MPKSFTDLFEDSHSALLSFLTTELSLGFTFAGMAQGYRDKGNVERYETNKRNATKAFDAIQQFKGRLSEKARETIEPGSAQLADLLATL